MKTCKQVNINFLKRNTPVKVTLFGAFFWILLFLLVPFNIKKPLGIYPFIYLAINYIFFLLGLKMITTTKKENQNIYFKNVQPKVIWIFFYITAFIALLGFFLKLSDKFFIRGASLGYSISYNRILLERSGASIISILSAITAPFSFLPLFVYFVLPTKNKLWLIVSTILFFSPALDFLMMGSRSGFFVIILLLGLFLFYHEKLHLTIGKMLFVFIVLFYIGITSIKLFIERTKDFAKTDKNAIEHILKYSGYNFTIAPTEKTKNSIIFSSNKTVQSTKLGVLNFSQYYLHGVYEFGYLYDNYKAPHYYGAYTFDIFIKFINTLFKTNINLKKIQESPPRTGVYTTFFGPIFIDYGWFSFLFMFFFGAIQKTIYNKCLQGRFQFVPLLFYFLIINFFMPVFNFINGAQGLYNIVCFIIFAIIFVLLTGKLKFKNKKGNIKYIKILK